ncbi:MAG: glycosyltransferase [Bacteroidales bacterium]|nr:glycosyltransferase [Bacteroidales bacterium]
MNLLFVASGNKKGQVSPIVKAQADSIIQAGLIVDVFPIIGNGLLGYLRAALLLRKFLKSKDPYNIIHAHYSLSAFTATLAGSRPLVVSLMGSDTNQGLVLKLIIRFFNFVFWRHCIVKSEGMRASLKIKNISVIPNGVDLNNFKPLSKDSAREQLGWDIDVLHVLFAANPIRPEKNFQLLESALRLLNRHVVIKTLVDVPHHSIHLYMNAADVVALPSLREGSPNVIKEAMACNRPIVSTKVGDVEHLFNQLKGCYLASFSTSDFADKLEKAIVFSESEHFTSGRDRIIKLGLSSAVVANQLLDLYERYGHKDE